jgi:hypothetical protein
MSFKLVLCRVPTFFEFLRISRGWHSACQKSPEPLDKFKLLGRAEGISVARATEEAREISYDRK